ncbi:MAG: serine--tRNA ligase, partial [Fervidicoccus fontis]
MPKWTVLEYLRNNPDEYMQMVKRRGLDESIVREAIEIDKAYRSKLREVENLRREHNSLTKELS